MGTPSRKGLRLGWPAKSEPPSRRPSLRRSTTARGPGTPTLGPHLLGRSQTGGRLCVRFSCPSLGGGYNFTAPNKHQWEANMRRAFIILLMGATLGISLQSTTPASAAPERFCAKWLYGASLQREAWGGWSYKYERLRCLKWVYLDIPQPNRFVPFFGFGAIPTDPSPWVTLNPQPLPPKARRANVR